MNKENYSSKNELDKDNTDLLSEYVNQDKNKDTYKREKEENNSQTRIQLVPPDGGWGWVVVSGGFISLILTAIPIMGFGILFSPLLMNSSVSSANVAWIFNVFGFAWNVAVLFIGPLCEEFGWRNVAITGGIIHFLSLFLSAFAPNAQFLFFSYSILGGIGGSIGPSVGYFVVARYFEKHRGFAIGIMTLGMCTGGFISPILSNFLLEQYGYMGAVLINAAITLNLCVVGALFQPVKWHMKRVEHKTDFDDFSEENMKSVDFEERELQTLKIRRGKYRKESEISAYSVGSLGQSISDVSSSLQNNKTTLNKEPKLSKNESIRSLISRILKSTLQNLKSLRFLQVIIIAIGSACLMLGYINFQMWISFTVMDTGHTLQMAAWCVSSASFANILGRLCMTLLSDRPKFSVKFGYMFGILFIGIFIIAFTLVKDIKFLLLFVCCWGFSVGAAMSLHPIVMIKTMGVDLFPAVYGVSALSVGVFSIIIGPIVGVIRDATSSYRYALWAIGGLDILAFCLWMMMPLAKEYDRKKQNDKVLMTVEDFS